MLACERTVRLANGRDLQSPLLVPSISSAGFKRVALEGGGSEPEPAAWLRVLSPFFNKGLLISAYDIAHGNLPETDGLRDRFHNSIYASPRTLIIDSGLYELCYGPPPHDDERRPWSREAYEELVAGLDRDSGAMLVNYDGYDDQGHAPFDVQIDSAQRFFAAHPQFGSDLLIKPERRGRSLSVDNLVPAMGRLRGFDVIGVTEKELGDSLLHRLGNLVTLRRRLTDAGVDAPIHLFGSLDPVLSPLYFAAGAEIFDGLTWLRYGYLWDATLYRDNVPVLEDAQNLDEPERVRLASILVGNLNALGALAERMRQFAVTKDWKVFGARVGDRLFDAHRALVTSMGE